MIASHPESFLNFRGSLLRSLLAKGLEVHVAAPGLTKGNPTHCRLASLGLHVHKITLKRAALSPFADLKTLFELWALMKRIKPNITLAYTIKPVIYGCFSAWLSGVSSCNALITGLGYSFIEKSDGRSFVRRIVRLLYRTSLSKSNRIFFQNPDDEALFHRLKIINLADGKTRIVNGSGVDLSWFEVQPLPKSPKFLMIARLLGDKGVREYVNAAKIVRRHYPETVFGLVGWFDDNPDAISQTELQEWVEQGDVKFHGHLDDVRPEIAMASVFVLPSYREGTPRTVLEAMAMGRPIVTTDVPGCRETVTVGKNGFLVPARDSHALARMIMRFIQFPELAAKMGKQSRQIAERKYDVKKVNMVLLEEMGIK